MADREPRPNNPLGPYYPAEIPNVPGIARTWFALLIAGLILIWAISRILVLLSL